MHEASRGIELVDRYLLIKIEIIFFLVQYFLLALLTYILCKHIFYEVREFFVYLFLLYIFMYFIKLLLPLVYFVYQCTLSISKNIFKNDIGQGYNIRIT